MLIFTFTIINHHHLKECISACLLCITGNAYGQSVEAQSHLHNILNKLDNTSWIYYFDNCFRFDENFLFNLVSGDSRVDIWHDLVNQYNLSDLGIKDGRIKEFLIKSKMKDKNNTKSFAISLLKQLGKY